MADIKKLESLHHSVHSQDTSQAVMVSPTGKDSSSSISCLFKEDGNAIP